LILKKKKRMCGHDKQSVSDYGLQQKKRGTGYSDKCMFMSVKKIVKGSQENIRRYG
jgi:hypothetical protein